MLGNAAMIAGRSIPGSVLRTKRDTAISAPVLPALTQACASPFFTSSTATRTDESFLLRSASAGDSKNGEAQACVSAGNTGALMARSEEHTSELQSRSDLV